MAKKAQKVQKENEAEKPEAPAPEPLTGVARFKSEFQLSSDVRPLRWEPVSNGNLRIFSPLGILCYADGSQVQLPAEEASQLASELRAIRPRDNIQLIP